MSTGYPQYAAYQMGGQSAAVADIKATVGTSADPASPTGTLAAMVKDVAAKALKTVGAYSVASNAVKATAAATKSVSSSTVTKAKEFKALIPGTIRVSFDHGGTGGYSVYAQIYKNGVAVGTARTATSATFTTWTEDILVAAGDLVQIYLNGNAAQASYVKNVKIAFDEVQSASQVIID